MLGLLRRRPDFAKLWLADAVSLLGDWLSYVAISVLVVESDGGWLALAMVLVLHTLPATLMSPFAGWLTDRMDARHLLFVSAVVRGLLTLVMVWAAQAESLLWLQVALCLRMAVGATENTTGRAALKQTVAPEELGLANAVGSVTWSVIFAAGVALGGVVTAAVGGVLALALDAATFALAAGLLLRLPPLPAAGGTERGTTEHDRTGQAATAPNGGGWGTALHVARRDPALGALVTGKLPLALATGGAWIYLNDAADRLDFVQDPALAIGLLQGARAVGTGLGPFAQRRVDGGAHRGVAAAAVVWGGFLCMALFHALERPALLLLVALGWGMSVGANWVNTTAGLLGESPRGMEGRLSAIDVVTQSFGLACGALLGAAVGSHFASSRWLVWTPLALGMVSWILTQRSTLRGANAARG